MHIAIHIDHVSKDFGPKHVLRDVCHDFEEGKIHGIVGNNGSGKTVLMKCICGFLLPTKGKVAVHNKQVGKDVDFPESLGLIIETPGFLPGLTGKKNLKVLASLRGKIDDTTICETLKQVGLDHPMKKPMNKYSLGMRQCLGIAQAIREHLDGQGDVSGHAALLECADAWRGYGQPNECGMVDGRRGKEGGRGVHRCGEGGCIWQERQVCWRSAMLFRETLRIVID